MSITAWTWVKANVQADHTYKALLSKWDLTANQRSWMICSSDLTDYTKLQVRLSSAGSAITKNYDSSITVFDNAWHFVGFTYDNNNNLFLYIDGVKDPNPTKTTDDTMTTLFDSSRMVLVGAYSDNYVLTGFLTGSLVESGIANRTFSQSEMINLYNTTRNELQVRGVL